MITIFTPTYNRKKYLNNIYQCLIRQTSKKFIWLIVDDGSTDDTENLINDYIKENKMEIKYYKQKNQGKHIAINTAIKHCKTEYMMCLDSDDILEDNAIEILENQLEKNNMNNVWAIVGPRKKYNGKFSWPNIKKNKIKFCWLYSKYKYVGETYLLMNTNLVKEYEFPRFENEKFIPEVVLYNTMDNKYDVLTCKEPIYVFDYLEGGYTKSGIKTLKDSAYGHALANLSCAQNNFGSKKKKFISLARYLAIIRTFKLNKTKFPNIGINRIIVWIAVGVSIFFEMKYKIQLYKKGIS